MTNPTEISGLTCILNVGKPLYLFTPIMKKENLCYPQNYRGISLTPIAAKVYNKMLLGRLCPHLDAILTKNQNGFLEGRSTISQILMLHRIVERIKARSFKQS